MTEPAARPTRPPCPGGECLRADGICCPDEECDAESGIYAGPLCDPPWIIRDSEEPVDAR